jgi:hydroxymethylglutaryl-CoA reductase
MAIEESSVVAAASKAAKFWSTRGGFKATINN